MTNERTTTESLEQYFNARHSRRLKAEDRFLTRLEKREAAAERMIGEIVRNGKTINYVFPVGGKYREGTIGALIGFLVRNNYV